MKFSLETVARVYAAGRNYIALGLGFATSAGIISASQNKTLTDSLGDIYQGVSLIVHGATSISVVAITVGGPIAAVVVAWYAQRSAKVENQAKAVQAAVVDPNTPISPEVKTTILTTAKAV